MPYARLQIIYEHVTHNMRTTHIARKLNLNTSTVKNILDAYKNEGRIFALQTLKSKYLNLRTKKESKETQSMYRQYRRLILSGNATKSSINYRWIEEKNAKNSKWESL